MFSRFHLRLLAGIACVLLACNTAADVPARLQVQLATAIPSATVPAPVGATLTAPPPTGAVTGLGSLNTTAIQDLLDAVQSDDLMVTVGTLADMQTRHVLSSPNDPNRGIGAARNWLVERFNKIRDANPERPISVWTQPVPFVWHNVSTATENVIATFQGTDVGAGVIVVGAHYDSITTNFTDGNAYAPGANDNASGVAAMLEIARILGPVSHRSTIMFVAFSAEETGRQGSLAFVNAYLQAQNPPIEVRGMLNLDIVGSENGPNGLIDRRMIRLFSAAPNDTPSRQLARQIALITGTYLFDVNLVVQSSEERAGRWGDHQSFSAAGYPAVRFIQGLEDLARQHSPRDTIDNVQPGYLMRATRTVLLAVSLLADGPPAPADMALRASTTTPDDPRAQTLVWTKIAGVNRYIVALRKAPSLTFDTTFTVDAGAELTWDSFRDYAALAVGSVDDSGRMGPLSPEMPIVTAEKK